MAFMLLGLYLMIMWLWLSCTNSGLYKMDRVTGKILKHYFKDSKETPIDSNIIRYIFIDSNHCVVFYRIFRAL